MKILNSSSLCPACGYPLEFVPWEGQSASDEICPSCGIQFGYDDFAAGNADLRQAAYKKWRQDWIARGMPWSSQGIEHPANWNPENQLRNLE